jgi:hypothetical protein
MKNIKIPKSITILLVVILILGAYFIGLLQGTFVGMETGGFLAGQSADMCKGMRAMALLNLLKEKKHAQINEALNHDLDYAIFSALNADRHIANASFPLSVYQSLKPVEPAENVENDIYCSFAEFRIKNPTQSKEKRIVEAIEEIITKYNSAQPKDALNSDSAVAKPE